MYLFIYVPLSPWAGGGFTSRSRITEPCSPIEGLGVWMASLMDLYTSSTPPKQATNKKKHSLELLHCCCWRELSTGDELHGKADVLSLPSASSSSRRRIEHQRRQDPRANEIDKIPFVAWQQMESARIREGASCMKGGKLATWWNFQILEFQFSTSKRTEQNVPSKVAAEQRGKLGKLDASFFLDGNDDDCNDEEKWVMERWWRGKVSGNNFIMLPFFELVCCVREGEVSKSGEVEKKGNCISLRSNSRKT